MKYLILFSAFLLAVSLFAFVLYGADKRKASQGRWRTRESVLLSVGFFGGGIGALLGMKTFHHKTKHWYFWLINIAGTVWQLAVLALLAMR